MFYLLIFIFFYPILKIISIFRKKSDKTLVIQNAVIGDYANSSIIFEKIKPFDIVLNKTNLAFANYDNRIINKFPINDYKNKKFGKLKLAFILFLNNYSNVYILTPNSLNLFLGKFTMAKNIVTIQPSLSKFKFLSIGTKKVNHSTNNLTTTTYLKMINAENEKYEKCIQNPYFIPKNIKIKNDKIFKIGISLSAGNKIKTPPVQTWNKIFEILSKFNCEIYIFGIKNEDELLKQIELKNNIVINFVNQIELRELPFYISLLNLYISSDTGNYYIADTMKIPTICLMGPCFSSEQRGVYNSLIINSKLKPISSVFKTVRDIDAKKYFVLSQDDEKNIYDFIYSLNKNLK